MTKFTEAERRDLGDLLIRFVEASWNYADADDQSLVLDGSIMATPGELVLLRRVRGVR